MATRRERVVLELQDDFTSGMARAAAATALMNRELGSLSKDSVRTKRSMSDIDDGVTRLGRNMEGSGRQIDRYSGRVAILGEAIAVLGPGLIPIGAVGIPAITGLASGLGFATLAAGTAALAFQGVGDALKAVDKAALQPTKTNLEAARIAMVKLPEAAQHFVTAIHQLEPELNKLRAAAADGFFPGAEKGIDALTSALPHLRTIVSGVATELGDIAQSTGESLASDRWQPFLDFLGREAPAALADMATVVGNTGHALAELWIAFTPLDHGFSRFLVDASDDLDKWAAGLSKTQGFHDFVAYIQKTGPQVADTFAAIANAVLQIVQAASPLGGPVLTSLQGIAEAVSAIANSDLGTPLFTAVAALSLFNRGIKATEALSAFGTRLDTTGQKVRTFGQNINRAGLAKSALLLGGLAVAGTGAADGIGLTNTAALTLAGSALPGLGTALGAAAGFSLDLAHANDQVTTSLNQARLAAESNSIAQVKAAQAALLARASQLAAGNGFKDNLRRISAFIAGNDEDLVQQSDALNLHLRDLQQGPLAGIGTLLTQNLGAPARQAALDVDGAAAASARFADGLAALNEKLQQSQNMIAFREALRSLNDVVKNNPLGKSLATGLGKQGAQGDAVRTQLLTIIQLTLQAASGLDAADQVGFLRRSRAEILQRATDLGIPLKVVKNLLDSFGVLDRTKATPKVGLDDHEFNTKKKRIQTFLDYLANKNIEPTIKFKARVDDPVLNTVLGLLDGKGGKSHANTDLGNLLFVPSGHADGATIPGARFPYGDRVPALLAPGEEIISNRFGQADRHRDLLKAINSNRYAGGGTVQPFASTVSNNYYGAASSGFSGADLHAIAALVANSRQLYGDVHISGDPTVFRKQLENDHRRSSLDGVQRGL